MPERMALITLLIIDRPLCRDCITSRSGTSPTDLDGYLARLRESTTVFHEGSERCGACGTVDTVYSLSRLPL
jgi:hypothetical protein